MKISTFDLNLFVILNAIYTQGSLTKAADVVGITQPAVSNALSRLRTKFNDDLFLRTGSGMIPTQKTENMIADIQNALMLMHYPCRCVHIGLSMSHFFGLWVQSDLHVSSNQLNLRDPVVVSCS